MHSQGPFHFIPDTLPSSQARQSEVKVRSGLSCSLRGHCDRPQDLLKRNMTYAADCNSCGGLQESVSYQGAHFGHEHTCTAHHECIFLLRRRRTGGSCRTWALLTDQTVKLLTAAVVSGPSAIKWLLFVPRPVLVAVRDLSFKHPQTYAFPASADVCVS